MANEYIGEIVTGTISRDLVETVESAYIENDYSVERVRKINIIGENYVHYEFIQIARCNNMLENLLSGELDCYIFAVEFFRRNIVFRW